MNNLFEIVNYIVTKSTELKNQFTDEVNTPVEFACIFCQNQNEYNLFTDSIERLGKIVQTSPRGYTYLLKNPIKTISGLLWLVKIRKPDILRKERGDADFNSDYLNLKKKYQNKDGFELVKRDNFEMIRLSNLKFDVMVCFSNSPMSKELGIKLE